MKYLKIVPFALVASFVSQDAMSIGEGAVNRVNQHVENQRVADQLVTDQNAYLGGLALPQTADYRAALAANGGHGAAPAIEVLILQVLETAGAAGILHGDAPQQAAVTAILLIADADHTDVTEDSVKAALKLLTPDGGGPIAVTENYLLAANKLLNPDGGGLALPVAQNSVDAAHKLLNPDAGVGPIAVNADGVADANALITAVGGPIDVSVANLAVAAGLRTGLNVPVAVTADSFEAYNILTAINFGGAFTGAQVAHVVAEGNLVDKKAVALLEKVSRYAVRANVRPNGSTYMEAAQAFGQPANDAAWKKAIRVDVRRGANAQPGLPGDVERAAAVADALAR